MLLVFAGETNLDGTDQRVEVVKRSAARLDACKIKAFAKIDFEAFAKIDQKATAKIDFPFLES